MGSRYSRAATVAFFWTWLGHPCSSQVQTSIPATQAFTLSGQHLTLPRDLPAKVNILIIGFGRSSQEATTAWERSTRTQLARSGIIDFYDMAMLAEIPSVMRPLVLRLIRHKVPDVLQTNFVAVTDDEDRWKKAAAYSEDQPEAAYVLVVDRSGAVRWRTHAPFSASAFAELRRHVEEIAGAAP